MAKKHICYTNCFQECTPAVDEKKKVWNKNGISGFVHVIISHMVLHQSLHSEWKRRCTPGVTTRWNSAANGQTGLIMKHWFNFYMCDVISFKRSIQRQMTKTWIRTKQSQYFTLSLGTQRTMTMYLPLHVVSKHFGHCLKWVLGGHWVSSILVFLFWKALISRGPEYHLPLSCVCLPLCLHHSASDLVQLLLDSAMASGDIAALLRWWQPSLVSATS